MSSAVVRTAPAYVDGRYNVHALAAALDGLPDGEPAVTLLNLPSNPGGYSLTAGERERAIPAPPRRNFRACVCRICSALLALPAGGGWYGLDQGCLIRPASPAACRRSLP